MSRRFEVATYEWQGRVRYDIGSHAFLTGPEARQLARKILATVQTTETLQARSERRPEPEAATAGEAAK